MRLTFDNGQVYVPYKPGIGDMPNYAQEASDDWSSGLSQSDPGSNLLNFAGTLPSAAMSGAATANMLGGGLKADIIGGAQAGLMTVAPFTGPAAPFILAAASLIGPIASMFKGCGETCKEATTIANNAATASEALLQRWHDTPVKYVSIQKAYLAAQADVWNYLYNGCLKIGGRGGQQCIADRNHGGKYDFFRINVDPVVNDPDVVPDPVIPGALSSLFSGTVAGLPMPLILGGAALLVFLLASGGDK